MLQNFVLGLYLGILVVFLWSMILQKGHHVGTDHNVCMEIQNEYVNGTHIKKQHCVTGEELIEWMRQRDGMAR